MKQSVKVIHTVTEDDLASTVKSGSMPVLATPVLICWLEQLSFEMLQGQGISVGYDVSLRHLKPSFLHENVTVISSMTGKEKNHVFFDLEVFNEKGELIAKGVHKRALIDPERFLSENH